MSLVLFYDVFNDVRLLCMWCFIVYSRMYETIHVMFFWFFLSMMCLIFFLELAPDFYYFYLCYGMLFIYLFIFMYIIIPVSWI
jgi:hypothetical protein